MTLAVALFLFPDPGSAPPPNTIGGDVVSSGTELAAGEFEGTVVVDNSDVGQVLTISPGIVEAAYVSDEQEAGHPFNALGLHWLADTPDGAGVNAEVRFSRDGEQWGEWQQVSLIVEEGPDHIDETSSAGETVGDLLYTDEARHFQYRFKLTANQQGESPLVRRVTASYIDAKGYHESPLSVDGALRRLSAWVDPPAAAAAPNIISRAQWGANEDYMQWTPQYVTPKKIILHHTVTSNSDPDPAATVRSIYYYHAVSLGWGDIGYNYLVDRQGRIYEGRYGGNGVVGGHALEWNYGSVGISVLGDYSISDITPQTYSALVSLMIYKSNQNLIDPTGYASMLGTNKPNFLGHRDVGSTACPGDYLYQYLPRLRNDAQAQYSQIPIVGAIRAKWDSLGGGPGAAVVAEYPVKASNGTWLGQAQDFVKGRLVWDQGAGGVYWIYGGIQAKYDQLGREAGILGMLRSDEYSIAGGRANDFAGGRIYWSQNSGSYAVRGAILGQLLGDGGVSRDGFPTSDEYDVAGYPGARAGDFQNARIYWSPSGGVHTVFGGIMIRYLLLGGPAAFGLPTTNEYDTPGYPGGRGSDFANGRIYWSAGTGPNGMTGAILARYLQSGGPAGGYGLPVDNEYSASNGRAQNLQGATITWERSLGTYIVYGGIMGKYRQLGGPGGQLGLAITDEGDVSGVGGARVSHFQGGRVFWGMSSGAHATVGAINYIYDQIGGAARLGLPVSDEYDVSGVPGGRESDLQGGRIYYHPSVGTNAVYGGILGKYLAIGGPVGHLGMPVVNEQDVTGVAGARQQLFQNGRLYWSSATGGNAVIGAILGKYLEFGGPSSALGMPVSDEFAYGSGRRSDFQGGYIYWDAQSGARVYTGNSTTITADAPFEVRDGNGTLLARLSAGQEASVRYSGGTYTLQAPGVSRSGNSHIRMYSPSGGIMKVTSYHDVPSWNTSLDDNRFRGAIEVRYSPVSNALWVINELPLESYMKGIAETSAGSPTEYLKTMTVAARSYAVWHLDRGGKYGSSEIFHLKNSRHGNGDDQVYKGYGLETRFPDQASVVNSTAGQVVTYGGAVAITPYFSNSDGRTRSAQEAWGVTSWPWLQSVPDPDCNGMAMNGHGVGISGTGALARAGRGDSYLTILGYYYRGTGVQTVDTNRSIRIAITRVS